MTEVPSQMQPALIGKLRLSFDRLSTLAHLFSLSIVQPKSLYILIGTDR